MARGETHEGDTFGSDTNGSDTHEGDTYDTDPQPPPDLGGDVLELTVPAQTGYLGVVRTATAGLAARLSFSLDQVEDLRIAVDEACVMLLNLPAPESTDEATLTCRFRVLAEGLAVTVSARVARRATLPARHSFAWQVLTAHAADVSGHASDGIAAIDLIKRRRPTG